KTGSDAICTVGIVGAGAMGTGIAQLVSMSGFDVRLFDIGMAAARQAAGSIAESLQRRVDKGRLTVQQRQETLARLTPVDTLADLAGCQIVIEAVVERVDVKQDVFRTLENVVDDGTIVA